MTTGKRRGRPAPLRWGGSLALAGIALAVLGGYLQFGDHAGAAAPTQGKAVTASPRPVRPVVPTPQLVTPSKKALPARPARPSRISIPYLDVSAPVVGIAEEDGALVPPSDPSKVGWWSGGALPGARRGSAVITGHTVHDGGGAFDDLEELRAGDVVAVTTSRGVLKYRVSGVTTYRKQALARSAMSVFDQNVAGRLVLVTCEDWNGKVYLSNVVVVAERMA